MANSQSSERPDLQDLVAYMQGRGSETMRAQVLQRLDEDEEYLELMMDLVPMLREAGELADPDATADPATRAPATQPMAPQTVVDAPLPAIAEPPLHAVEVPVLPGKVVALPRRTRRPYGVFAALAAMIPMAVAVWMTTRPRLPLPTILAKGDLASISSSLLEEGPWKEVTRGAAEPACIDADDAACFEAGAQMVDLQIALAQGSEKLANRLLPLLATNLGADFPRFFPGLDGKGPFALEKMKKKVEAGYPALLKYQDRMPGFEEGACLRAAVLAAKANKTSYFEDRQKQKRCLEVVGENNWKPDFEALADRYFEVRTGNPNLP